jgi:predicted secreted Zn-dependent protease
MPADTFVHWYEVEGQSPAQVRAQLDRLGPVDARGQRHDAFTEWYVTWHFPFARTDEGCSLGPVETKLRVTVTLPRLVDGDAVGERFDRYLHALWAHESGHRDTGLRAEGELDALLPTLPVQPTCDEAEAAGNAAARAVLERMREEDLAYDLRTRHGETQGAVFP